MEEIASTKARILDIFLSPESKQLLPKGFYAINNSDHSSRAVSHRLYRKVGGIYNDESRREKKNWRIGSVVPFGIGIAWHRSRKLVRRRRRRRWIVVGSIDSRSPKMETEPTGPASRIAITFSLATLLSKYNFEKSCSIFLYYHPLSTYWVNLLCSSSHISKRRRRRRPKWACGALILQLRQQQSPRRMHAGEKNFTRAGT